MVRSRKAARGLDSEDEVMSDLVEFTVDRSKWLRGDASRSLLLNLSGERCCVGFLVQQVFGCTDGEVRGVAYARDAYNNGALADLDVKLDREESVYDINDNGHISDVAREAELTERFARIGYRPIFIDGDGQ